MKCRGAMAWSILALSVLLVVVLVLLGNWQLQRLDWKLDLIDAIEQRTSAAPVPAPVDAVNPKKDVYRRVVVSGRYFHDQSRLVKAVTELGPGYWVMTPLADGQQTVWINRGYVPAERRERGGYDEPSGIVTINGLLRITEPNGSLLQKNDPAAGRWYSRDADALSTDSGIDARPDYFIDAEAQASGSIANWPRAGLTRLDFRNTHLAYALTWYAMAMALTVGMAWVVYLERTTRQD